jgi:hypothetical protein
MLLKGMDTGKFTLQAEIFEDFCVRRAFGPPVPSRVLVR